VYLTETHNSAVSYPLWPTVSTDLMCCLQKPPCRWSCGWPKFYIMSNLTGSDQQYWLDTIMSLCKPLVAAFGDLIWVELSRAHIFHSALHIMSELILHLSSFIFYVSWWTHVCNLFFPLTVFPAHFLSRSCLSLSDVLTGWHLVLGCPLGLLPLNTFAVGYLNTHRR